MHSNSHELGAQRFEERTENMLRAQAARFGSIFEDENRSAAHIDKVVEILNDSFSDFEWSACYSDSGDYRIIVEQQKFSEVTDLTLEEASVVGSLLTDPKLEFTQKDIEFYIHLLEIVFTAFKWVGAYFLGDDGCNFAVGAVKRPLE